MESLEIQPGRSAKFSDRTEDEDYTADGRWVIRFKGEEPLPLLEDNLFELSTRAKAKTRQRCRNAYSTRNIVEAQSSMDVNEAIHTLNVGREQSLFIIYYYALTIERCKVLDLSRV